MKVLGIMVLLMVIGTTYLLLLNISNTTTTNFPVFDTSSHGSQNVGMTGTKRKLKGFPSINEKKVKQVNLEDYNPIDPVVPSSKASVRPGPIQHGTPLIPFIPIPSPPEHPVLRDSP